jgi:hypothetical protein
MLTCYRIQDVEVGGQKECRDISETIALPA